MNTGNKDVFNLIADHKGELTRKFHVKAISVVGSVVRGDATSNSDVDVLVKYSKTPGIFTFIELKQYLEAVTGRTVDLVTEGALKKQLKKEILREEIRGT
ncbi:MAG: nucleotidyltransferase [Desulforhopalus sp.]|nr:nucleotidyltransferase [Desulforhopalus sp.]